MNRLSLFLIYNLFFIVSCGKSPLFDHTSETGLESLRSLTSLDSSLHSISGEWNARVYWQQGPLVFDECQMTLMVTNKNGELVDFPSLPTLSPWMPDHGHGTSPVIVKRLEKGIYFFSEIFFIMPGFWEMQLDMGGERVKWSVQL